MPTKRKRENTINDVAASASTSALSVLAEDVVATKILPFLHRKAVLRVMSDKPIRTEFHLTNYYCAQHGTMLEPTPSSVGPKCEDCLESIQGKLRCDRCYEFQQDVSICDCCEMDCCVDCIANHPDDGCQGFCYECKTNTCGLEECPSVQECDSCLLTYCTDCRVVSTCMECGQQHCDQCTSSCAVCQDILCAGAESKCAVCKEKW